ncbi:MAG: PilZ domain-containing protein [Oscillospiraceae bacterium]|nr:PilZ domain-containing protein [Oscillospiraceae bacterium]MCL2279443.1 PilZ domain-containing protein [Oscillospiraceae bacterium]
MKKQEQVKAPIYSYVGCAVILFDQDGNTIGNTTVIHNDNETLLMEVQVLPDKLSVGSTCRLLIFTDPEPCEYYGKIVTYKTKKVIALYRGRVRSKRREQRVAINTPAQIESLFYSGREYPLHTPVKVTLINVSKGGMRFSAKTDTSIRGNKFRARVSLGETEKLIVAEVVNVVDAKLKQSEYGCKFVGKRLERDG